MKGRLLSGLVSVVIAWLVCAMSGATAAVNHPNTGLAQKATNTIQSNAAGEYLIYFLKNGEWQKAGELAFDQYLQEKELAVDAYPIGSDTRILLRVIQKGGGDAHIDMVSLGGHPPVGLDGAHNPVALNKLIKPDFDLLEAHDKTYEIAFPSSDGHGILKLRARVEPDNVSHTPFQFPLTNLYRPTNESSHFYSYNLDLTKRPKVEAAFSKNAALLFKEYCRTGSGHPSGNTYGWVSHDEYNLYVKIDFTPANTLSADKDYAKVYIKTDSGLKSFKVSASEHEWGQSQFTYTDKVDYQHKVFNFKIPLDEAGVAENVQDQHLQLAFSAYGSASPNYGRGTPVVGYDPITDLYLIVYTQAIDLSGATQIRGHVVDAAGSIINPDLQIFHGPVGNFDPAIAYDSINGIFLIVWEHYAGLGGDSDIYGLRARVNADGSVNLDSGFTVNNVVSGDQEKPAVAFDSNNGDFWIVWEDGRLGPSDVDIYGARLEGCNPFNAACSGPQDFYAVTNAANVQRNPSIAYDSNRFELLVVWEDYEIHGGVSQTEVPWILGQFLDSSGNRIYTGDFPVADVRLVTGNSGDEVDVPQYNPTVGYDSLNNKFIVVWEDFRDDPSFIDSQIYGQRLNRLDCGQLGCLVTQTPPHRIIVGAPTAGSTIVLRLEDDFNISQSRDDTFNPSIVRNNLAGGFHVTYEAQYQFQTTTFNSVRGRTVDINSTSNSPIVGPVYNSLVASGIVSDIDFPVSAVNSDSGNALLAYVRQFQLTADPDDIALSLISIDGDFDGMDDDWEITHFGDLSRDGTSDVDDDNLSDLDEFQNGTDPLVADSDGDGYYDGEEVNLGSDPTVNTSTPTYAPGAFYLDISTGSDISGEGSSVNPWKTIHHAVSRINGGTPGSYVLNLAAGTYDEAHGEFFDNGILAEVTQSQVTIQGAGPSLTFIDGMSSTYPGSKWNTGIQIGTDIIAPSSVLVKDLTVSNFVYAGIEIYSGGGGIVDNCHVTESDKGIVLNVLSSGSELRNGCEIFHNGEGVRIDGASGNEIHHTVILDNAIGLVIARNGVTGADDNLIRDNTIFWSGDLSYRQDYGIMVGEFGLYAGVNNRIARNVIRGTDADKVAVGISVSNGTPDIEQNTIYECLIGISLHYDSGAPEDPVIWNNLIHNSEMGIYIEGDTGATAAAIVYHNTIVADPDVGTGTGIYQASATPVDISFNIIADFDVCGIGPAGGTVGLYNNSWGNGTNYCPATVDASNRSLNPGFVNTTSGFEDYHLAVGSPCIDAIPTGNPPNDPVNMDLGFTARPQGPGLDIGAYEAPSADSDGDGMEDGWEQQIIDANPTDGITSIADVLPGDDFDGDGIANAAEFSGGTSPISPDAGAIAGRVTDLGLTALAGVRVYALSEDFQNYIAEAYTGTSGYFAITNLADGNYHIVASRQGYGTTYYGGYNDPLSILITIAAPDSVGGIDFALEVEGTLSGNVTDFNGDPFVGATVQASPMDGGQILSAITDSSGDYTIRQLGTGDYRVSVDYTGYPTVYYNDVNSIDQAAPVAVSSASNTPGIDFQLDHSAMPVVDLDGWGVVTYTTEDGTGLDVWVKVIDHDGGGADDSFVSHTVTVTHPVIGTVPLNFHHAENGNTAYFNEFASLGDLIEPIENYAGDWTFTVTDPDGNTSSTVDTLAVAPLPVPDVASFQPIDGTTIADTTPTLIWAPVSGTNAGNVRRYQVRIYSDDLSQSVWQWNVGLETTYTVPPGVLGPNTAYRYCIQARDANTNFENDNVSTAPADQANYIRFTTGTESADPYIDWSYSGVETWSGNSFGPTLSFWVRVFDPQGVPGDIESVTAILPGGRQVPLRYEYNEDATSAIYQTDTYDALTSGGYILRVEDREGNFYETIEVLNSDPIGFPAESSFVPLRSTLVGSTGVNFDWADVPDAAFYRVEIYDRAFDRIYTFATTQSQFNLPEGYLEEGTYYAYRITTRREFFDENTDNGSSSPWYLDNRFNFITTATSGSASPSIDTVNWGAVLWHFPRPDNPGASYYWRAFQVMVTDADGPPHSIQQVEVTFPDGTTKRTMSYDSNAGSDSAYYWYMEDIADPSAMEEGTYTFTAVDVNGNVSASVTDEFTRNTLLQPTGLLPMPEADVYGTTPTISWNPVPGAAIYRLEIYNESGGRVHRPYLTGTSYTIPAGILEMDKTYSYRVRAHREDPNNQDMDNMSSSTWFRGLRPHFAVRSSVDSDSDGLPDDWEQQIVDADPSDGIVTVADVLPGDDFDGDGLSNQQELANGTIPVNHDTDNDGVNDGDEVANGTSPTDPLSFTPAGTGAISGILKKENGDPITGVQIQVEAINGDPCGDLGDRVSVQTNSIDGTYGIAGLTPGTYYLTTNHMNQSDYVNEWWTGGSPDSSDLDCSSAQLVTVSADSLVPDTDFNLESGGSLSGRVLDENSDPIDGLWMHVFTAACGGSWLGGAETDSNGDFTISGLPAGTVYLQTCAGCGGFNYVDEWWDGAGGTADCNGALGINVTAGDNSGGNDFQLETGGSISGVVTRDSDNQPIEGISVEVWEYSSGQGRGGFQTQSDGRYTISGLAAGNYRLMARATGTAYASEYYDDVLSWDAAAAVGVPAGGTTSGINFSLGLGGSISGTVLDQLTGQPVEDTSYGSITLDVGWHKFVYRQIEVGGGQASRAAFKAPGDIEWRWFSTSELNVRVLPDANAEAGITLVNKRHTCQDQYPGNHQEMVQCVDVEATEEAGWYGQSIVSIVNQDQNVHGEDDNYTSYYEGYFYVNNAGDWFFSTDSDDASEIVIDNQLVAGWYGGHSTMGRWEDRINVDLFRYDNREHIGGTSGNPDGSYLFTNIQAGSYILEATAPGYLLEFFQDSFDWDQAAEVIVNPPQEKQNIDFTLAKDADGDEMADDWEITHFGDLSHDGNADTDNDGLTDRDEYRNNTDPNDSDSDGDKLSDGYEFQMGTDPASNTSTPPIPITSVLHRVTEYDGSLKTYIEVEILDGFVGTLPDDVSDIIVRAPDNSVVVQYALSPGDWTFYPQWRDFFISLNGEPTVNGVFSFQVQSGTLVGTDTDHQYTTRDLPIPDASRFSPANGAVVSSKTPSFQWRLVDYPENIPLYYRLEIDEQVGADYQRAFATGRIKDLSSFTLPLNVLKFNTTYRWRIRLTDSSRWEDVQNRSDSAWLSFTTPAAWVAHASPPAIDLDGWGNLSWTWNIGQTGTEVWVRVYDLDGVASDGSSHFVTIQRPGDLQPTPMYFVRSEGPTSAGFECWFDSPPVAGTYTFTITDPDGNSATLMETLGAADINPLDPPVESSITPNLLTEYITASFDNVYINGDLTTAFEDFDSYTSINDIDWSKWNWHDNASIQRDNGNGWLVLDVGNSVGRANGQLNFADPSSINAIKAVVTITNASTEAPRAEIGGTWCNNGLGDVIGRIRVTSTGVYYSVSQEYINEQETAKWDTLASGALLSGNFVDVPVTAEIVWDEASSTLTFTANGSAPTYYFVSGNVGPPISNYKDLRTRINLVTDTTPTFTWDPVTGADRYRLRIYNYNNNRTVGNGYTGNEPSYTVPPGVLNPNSYYRFRIEAWDAHSPLNVNNVSKTPASNDGNYSFYTDDQEAVDPYIEFDNSGVRTWNDSVNGAFLLFRVIVHDAQGVPNNIRSVSVEHPSGWITTLDASCSDSYSPSSPTSCIYSKGSDQPIENGDYIFTVEDLEGHIYTVSEALTPDVLNLPVVQNPVNGATINDTAVLFDWTDVPGAAFYSLDIYDYDFNRIYTFHTEQSQFSLAAGFLKNQTFYRWWVKARREYFSENTDNNSASSDFWNMSTFTTTPLVDSDGDLMPDAWETLHGVDDPNADADGDGLSNLGEYENATDPNNPDTDGDGRNDGREVAQGTNPNLDTDYSGIPDIERDALIALYNSTTGSEWTDSSDWLSDTVSECDWFGVTCSGNYVQNIVLTGNQLSGPIPTQLGSLSNLQALYLNNNQLTGSIPIELFGLSSLIHLYLDDNLLSGPIPTDPSTPWDLPALAHLYLDNNNLDGPIPPELGSLTALTHLYLYSNQLSGSIPTQLGSLSNLQALYLNNNQLTGSIPIELFGLSSLIHLYLDDNLLSGPIPTDPSTPWDLPALAHLYLDNNNLDGPIPPELGSLTALTHLYLYSNQLSGTIPTQLGSLSNLQALYLNNNQLTGSIPTELGNLSALVHLYLGNNQLTGSIPSGLADPGELPLLTHLYLNNNQLDSSIPASLGNLLNLEALYLNQNRLSGSIPTQLGNLASLQALYLYGNALAGEVPDSLTSLSNLVNDSSDFRWNALYTFSTGTGLFLNAKQIDGDWESTQTVAPTDLSATTVTDTTVELSWTPILYIGDSGGYEIEYAETSGGIFNPLGTTASKSESAFTINDLESGREYFLRVLTATEPHTNNQNFLNSDYTPEVSITTSGFLDSDLDGLPDDWEQRIVDADANDTILVVADVLFDDDFDGDGLNNQGEFDNSTDPIDTDSDDDGWSDLQEIQANTSAIDPIVFPIFVDFTVGGPGASDLNLGDTTYPLATLHAAVSRINSLADGAYGLSLAAGTFSFASGEANLPLSIEQDLSITGAGILTTTIDGAGASAWTTGLLLSTGAADVSLQGLTIQGFDKGIALQADAACLDLQDVTVLSCQTGLAVCDASMLDIDLGNAIITENQTGILLGGSSSAIRNGSVTLNTGDGILMDACGGAPYDNLIEFTSITANGRNGILILDGSGNRVTGATITGNNTAGSGYGGVAVFGGCTSVHQSTISGNQCFGIYADESLSQSPVEATDNEWGDPSGPSGAGFGTGNAVSEYVVFIPWVGQTQLSPGTYFVDNTNGSDDLSHGGAIGTGAWRTLHFAIDTINSGLPGDYTLELATGTYDVTTEGAGGEPEPLVIEQNLILRGVGVTIDGAGATAWTTGFLLSTGAAKVSLEGLTIQGFDKGIALQADAACLDLQDVTVRACQTGLAVCDASMLDIDLGNAIITQNQTGILLGGSSSAIRNGSVTLNIGDGILMDACGGAPYDNLIEFTSITANGRNGILILDGSGNRVTGATITGNHTAGSGYGGVAVFGGCTSVHQSTISGNACFGVYADESLSQSPVDATDNEWGDPSGPSGAGFGTGNAVSEYVVFTPWVGQTQLSPGTYFVDNTNGSDDLSHGGAIGTGAWRTLHFAIDIINSGLPGDYTLELADGSTFSVADGDTPLVVEQNLTLSGLNVTLDGTGASAWTTGLIVSVGAANVTLENIRIVNFQTGIAFNTDAACLNLLNGRITGCQDGCDTGIEIRERNQIHIDLDDSLVSGWQTGVAILGGSSNRIINGRVASNAGNGLLIDACQSPPTDNVIQGVTIDTSQSTGVALLAGSGNRVTDCRIFDNNLSMNGFGGIAVTDGCAQIRWNSIQGNQCANVHVDEASGVEISGNLITGSDVGIRLGFTTGGQVASNTITGNDRGLIVENGSKPDIRYNIIWDNIEIGPDLRVDGAYGVMAYNDIGTTNLPGLPPTNMHLNPIFSNPTAGDYTLNAASACIDATTLTDAGRDLAGVTRPKGNTWDMGAFESQRFADTDQDDMDDAFEMIIVNADGTDAIEDVFDVLASDDFDNDGISNYDEWEHNTDPTVANVLVRITNPLSKLTHLDTGTVDFSGVANNAARVVLSSSRNVSMPVVVLQPDWTFTAVGIPLLSGENIITARATEIGGQGVYIASRTVVRDSQAPVVAITSPTTFETYKTALSVITLGGSASDDSLVSSVAWSSGASSGGSPFTPANTVSWSASGIPLVPGENLIVITATDSFGKTGTQSLVVVRQTTIANEPVDLSDQGVQPAGDPLDLDGDGYLNADETACNSNPNDAGSMPANLLSTVYPANHAKAGYSWPNCLNPDDDLDGLTDEFELSYAMCGLDPQDAGDAGLDADGDTLTNLEEFQNGTNPCQAQAGGFQIAVVDANDSDVYANWLPAFTGAVKIRATWIGGVTPPATAYFSLKDTSKYPGRAVNDPDPGRIGNFYPAWYQYSGPDFGLTTSDPTVDPNLHSYDQGPVPVAGAAGVFEAWLQSYDYGGRVRVMVADQITNPAHVAQVWVPRGSGVNGISSNWEHDAGTTRLASNADMDAIVFDTPYRTDPELGDDFSNFEEYRGVVYTAGIGGTLRHLRLHPRRKDLFIRGIGFGTNNDPLEIGMAFYHAGIDIHDTTDWGHDATEDDTFFTYYRAGTITSVGGVSGNEVIGLGTEWWWPDPNQTAESRSKSWPRHEWEFKLNGDNENAWTPVKSWVESNRFYLDLAYGGTSGNVNSGYAIRMPVPHINVLIVRQDTARATIRFDQDGHIIFNSATAPDTMSPSGIRHWGWTTKGYCLTSKEDEQPAMYGFAVHMQIPLDHYFNDRPYVDGTTWSNGQWIEFEDGHLAPLSMVEDQKDLMAPEDGILEGDGPNNRWDGDHRNADKSTWSNPNQLSPFDVDGDRLVELPTVVLPEVADPNSQQPFEYTMEQVRKHTITHEIGHALGGPGHTLVDPACLMYTWSVNWSRDDYLSDGFKALLRIHNRTR